LNLYSQAVVHSASRSVSAAATASELLMALPDALPPTIKVKVKDLPGPDFTTYLPIKPESTNVADSSLKPDEYSLEGPCVIETDTTKTEGRGLKCRAYRNAYWSTTVRCDAQTKPKSSNDYSAHVASGLREYIAKHPAEKQRIQEYLGYCPLGFKEYSALFQKPPATKPKAIDPQAPIFLNDINELCAQLKQILLPSDAVSPTGLITITGPTDSSKSLITRGLIFLYLREVAEKAFTKNLRRPHLVTFEDPIEQFFIREPAINFAPKDLEELEKLLATIYIDYTPRQKKTDTDKLSNAIQDAKRQTPAVFFIGETRDPHDWTDLLEFSGSGHLVITTSHAGSVVEAMTQMFRETETQTPAQRSEIARRILGIVNLRSLYPIASDIHSIVRVLLPAVWKSNPQSINNLVADGLSSILPALGREQEIGYYGRTYFAHHLLANATHDFEDCGDVDALKKEITREAMKWDIGGI
jgi:hypothetical protein